jgi:hypothetical protein
MGALARVNRTPISPKLLGEAMELHSEMAANDRPVVDAQIFQLIEFLKDKGFTGRRHSDLVVAINFRLMALARLVQGDHVKGWTVPCQEKDLTYLHGDVLKAAAMEALIEDEDGFVLFDANTFALRVLELSSPEGHS